MNNRGQIPPLENWIAGIVLLFTLYIVYGNFQPIIDTTMPAMINGTQGNNADAGSVIENTKLNWTVGILGLGFIYLFYILVSGLIGQREERYV